VLPKGFKNGSRDKSKEFEAVFLNSLDGFGFEAFCERLFEKSGWGRIERIGMVGDAGRDLIIHTSQGKIVVECKHQPNSTIGRPIVQKLHSAVISAHTKKGIIITTGKFSKQAIEYSKNLTDGTKIELFDMHKIAELAQKGGIKIADSTEDLSVYTYPISNQVHLKNKLQARFHNALSSPSRIFDLLNVTIVQISLLPTYEAIVDVDQDFVTSAGLIHQIKDYSTSYFFDGNGRPLNITYSHHLPTQNSTILFDKSKLDNSIHVGQFNLNKTSLTEIIQNEIIQQKSINVQYWGKNNVAYTKLCIPNKKSIRINDINQIHLPQYKIHLKILRKYYVGTLIENKNKISIPETDLYTCRICRQQIEDVSLVCNSCGNICHPPKSKGDHSYFCEICKKTICRHCTYYTRKYLFMKKKLCMPCAEQNSKTLKKLVPNN